METRHSVELASQGRVGYLFKDRVLEVDDFMDAFMAEGRNNIGIARRVWLTVLTWLGLRRRSQRASDTAKNTAPRRGMRGPDHYCPGTSKEPSNIDPGDAP